MYWTDTVVHVRTHMTTTTDDWKLSDWLINCTTAVALNCLKDNFTSGLAKTQLDSQALDQWLTLNISRQHKTQFAIVGFHFATPQQPTHQCLSVVMALISAVEYEKSPTHTSYHIRILSWVAIWPLDWHRSDVSSSIGINYPNKCSLNIVEKRLKKI